MYSAIAKNGKYEVVIVSKYGSISPTTFRKFDTFEEADDVARKTADGIYNYKPGQYLNMR